MPCTILPILGDSCIAGEIAPRVTSSYGPCGDSCPLRFVSVKRISYFFASIPGQAMSRSFFSRTSSRPGGRQRGTRLRKHVPPCTRARRHASGFRRGHCMRGLPPGRSPPGTRRRLLRHQGSRIPCVNEGCGCNFNRTIEAHRTSASPKRNCTVEVYRGIPTRTAVAG